MNSPSGRLWLYISKTYPPPITLPYAAISFLCLAWTLLALRGAPPSIGTWCVPGILTTFFFLLFLRVSDEIKDAEVDKSLFPDRLLPSGKVTMPDVRLLWWLSLAGSLLLLSYALFYEKDSVFIFAYAFTWIPYIRNLVIHRRHAAAHLDCASCGQLCPPHSNFCLACGARLGASAETILS